MFVTTTLVEPERSFHIGENETTVQYDIALLFKIVPEASQEPSVVCVGTPGGTSTSGWKPGLKVTKVVLHIY